MSDSPSSHRFTLGNIFTWLYFALIGGVLVMAYRNALPPQLEYIPYYDKIGHMLIYGVAAYLGERWVRHRRFRLLGVRLPLFVTLFSLFVVAEELVQYFSPHRNLDPGDLVMDAIGIAIGTALAMRGRGSVIKASISDRR
jgi:VanZ family protein